MMIDELRLQLGRPLTFTISLILATLSPGSLTGQDCPPLPEDTDQVEDLPEAVPIGSIDWSSSGSTGSDAREREASDTMSARVLLFLDEDGNVQCAEVQQSSGHDDFNEGVLRALRHTEFTPIPRDEGTVAGWSTFSVAFVPHRVPPRS